MEADNGFPEWVDCLALTDEPIKYGLLVEDSFTLKDFEINTTVKYNGLQANLKIIFKKFGDCNLYYSQSPVFVPVMQNVLREFFNEKMEKDYILFQPYGTCLQKISVHNLNYKNIN